MEISVRVTTKICKQKVGISGNREWGGPGLGAELISRCICKAVINELQFIMGRASGLPAALLGLQARIFNYAMASSFNQIIPVTW